MERFHLLSGCAVKVNEPDVEAEEGGADGRSVSAWAMHSAPEERFGLNYGDGMLSRVCTVSMPLMLRDTHWYAFVNTRALLTAVTNPK